MKDRKLCIAISSFISGMGSILDMSSLQLNEKIKRLNLESDIDALSGDWRNVGKDLSSSIENYGNSIKGKTIEGLRG